MAKKTEKLTIQVDADTRQADRKLSALDKDLEHLGGGRGSKTTIKVDADTDAAERSISDLLQDVEKLDSQDATIELKLEEANLAAQLASIKADVDKLDASDPIIDLKMEQGTQLMGDIDRIQSKLKEIGDTNFGGLNASASDLDTRMRGVHSSSDQSRSVLANLAGNAAQDLGQLGGVVGSLGVGIGQLAEYAVDGNIALKDLAKVAGPMVGLTAALVVVQGISKGLADLKAAQEAYTQQQEDFNEVLRETGSLQEAVNEQLEANRTLTMAPELNWWQGMLDDLPVLTGLVDEMGGHTQDLIGDMAAADITQREWTAAVTGGLGPVTDLLTEIDAMAASNQITAEQAAYLKEQLLLYSSAAVTAEGQTAAYNEVMADTAPAVTSLADAQALLNKEMIAADPMAVLHGHWQALIQDAKDGTFNYENAADAINQVVKATGLNVEQVINLVNQKASEEIQAEADAYDEAAKKAAEMALAVGDLTVALSDINADDIDNITSAFEDALDASDSFLDNLKFQVDFDEAFSGAGGFLEKFAGEFKPDILELAEFMRSNLNVGDSITWGELKKDDPEFASLMVDMSTMIREGAVKAYETGGTEAANAFVQSQAQALVDAVPGLTLADVYRLLGLPPDGSLDTIIKPIIDAEAKADALATLEALAGVDPDNPIISYLKLQLQTGAIDPVIAEIAALILAGQYGVDVDAQLKEFTPAQIAAAQAQIDAAGGVTVQVNPEMTALWDTLWTTPPEPVTVPVTVTAPEAGAVSKLVDAVADKKRTADINVKADNAGAIDRILDAVAEQERTADIDAKDQNVAAVDATLDTLAMPSEDGRLAHIFAQPDNIGPADSALDNVANPSSTQGRVADIFAHINEGSRSNADRTLDNVARDRTADIFVVTHNTTVGGGGGGGGGGGASAQPNLAPLSAEPMVFGVESLAAPVAETAVPSATVASSSSFVLPASQPSVVNHLHVTVQAAVIGNRFDVQRAVARAVRGDKRLNGTRVL